MLHFKGGVISEGFLKFAMGEITEYFITENNIM